MTSEEALQMANFIESSTEALSKQLDKYADHFPDPIWDNAPARGRGMNKLDDQTSYERATRQFDPEFRDRLVNVITEAIAGASIVSDQRIMVLRSTEMIDALVIVLMSTMSLSPQFDSPTKLRKFVDEVAKRIRRNVANARADPNHGAHILGARRGGTA